MVKRGLNRDRLVAIAHDYVTANGLDALTMRRLAAAAEVTPGALYKHVRDRKDLQRAMTEAIYRTIDLSDIDLDHPTVEQVIICCGRMRNAMLGFRDGGRIVAGSYSPFAATSKLSSTMTTLLRNVTVADFTTGDIVSVLRSYTIGFVIEEQAYLELRGSGEWDPLVRAVSSNAIGRVDANSDPIAIMTGDRDERFAVGLTAVLTGIVRPAPDRPADGEHRTR